MGLFGRAKSMLRGDSSPIRGKSQFYHVACAEGHVLHGQRTDGYQAMRCPTCGEGIFVLPRSPLPDPAVPSPVQAKRPAARSLNDDEGLILSDPPAADEAAKARSQAATEAMSEDENGDEIEWVDEVEPDVQPTVVAYQPDISTQALPAESRTSPSRRRLKAKPAPATVAAKAVPARMIEVEDRASLGERVWKRRNALIFVGVGLLVVVTISLRLRQQYLASLPTIVENGRTEGLAKLDAGDFQVAKQILVEAASAVEALGGQVEGAVEVRQGAQEAALFADRVGETLETLVESASKAESEAVWSKRFNTLYKGQSIIVETRITAVPDPDVPGSAYRIDFPIILFGGTIEPAGKGRIDLTGFRLFELEKPAKGEDKVFGARLESMRFDKEKGEWLIGLVPDSGCFITHDKALSHVFGPPSLAEEETR